MKKSIIIAIILFSITALFGWDIMRQTQFPTTFTDMSRAGSHFWSVGSGGAVVKSTDNGNTWTYVPNPGFNAADGVYMTINGVSFYDENHGVIAGNDGFLAITDNGGTTWTVSGNVASIYGLLDIKAVHYISSGKIMVAGDSGKMAYSSNFGASFSEISSSVTTPINTVYFEDTGLTFIGCGSAVVKKSLNFGTDWTALSLNNAQNPHVYKIRKIADRLYLVGNKGFVGYSDDNGDTFTNNNGLGTATTSFYDLVWNGTIGYAVANGGYLVKTTNNFNPGSNTVVSTYFTDTLRGCSFNTNNELIASGSYGAILKWNDATEKWIDVAINAIDLYSLSMGDANTWYISGDRGVFLKTTNGGQTFERVYVPGEMLSLNSNKFFDANNGLITGKTSGKIYKTTNGGTDWTSFQVPGVTSTQIYRKLTFVNDQIGYAIGGSFNAKTTNGGESWTMTTNTGIGTSSLYTGFFKNENTGYAGGASGAVYVTTDGAQTWSTFNLGNKIITDIYFYDDNNGFILTEATVSSGSVTQSGKLFKTTNGGLTASDWTEITLPVAVGTLSGITRLTEGTLYIAGYSNNVSQQGTNWAILKSVDNGLNWTEETLPSLTFNPTQFKAIAFNDNKITAIGNNQLIMRESLQPTETFATELFISEYEEGTSFNKCIEIFNGTGQTVDLSNYSVKIAPNGGSWGTILAMTGTLENNNVYVISHPSANATILNQADVTSDVTNYNGDDALGLFHGDNLIDAFGVYQTDPGTAWNVAGVVGATLNHTLVRKPTVISPTPDWATSAGTDVDNSQWIVYSQDTFTYLGSHEFAPVPATVTNAPSMSPPPGIYYDAVNVTLGCITPNSTIYYTLDGSIPTNQSTQYTQPIVISQTTTIKAIAFATGFDPSTITTGEYTINSPVMISNIAELRTQAADNTTIYKLTGEAIVTYKQAYRYQRFIQDATAGILVDDFTHIVSTNFNIGDGITNLTGKLSEYGGMLQFTPILNNGPASSTGNIVTPQIITINQFNTNFEAYESELVKFENVQFVQEGNFVAGTAYFLHSGQDTLNFRTSFYDANYIGDPIPQNLINVIGIANSRTDGLYFTARDSSDFSDSATVLYPPQNLTAVVTDNDVTLNWGAPIPGVLRATDSRSKQETCIKVVNTQDRNLLGYNVYRNEVLLTNTPLATTVLSYVDEDLTAGQYTYLVTAVYSEGESQAVQATATITEEVIITTFPWSEGFENGFLPSGWSQNDQDGDSNLWFEYTAEGTAHSGTKSAASASYLNNIGALTPNNWLITPKMVLPQITTNQNLELTYWVSGQDVTDFAEHYSVSLSDTNTNPSSFVELNNETLQSDQWVLKTIDLSSHTGQTIYLAFRHFNVTNMFYLKLDDIRIEVSNGNDVEPIAYTTKLGKNYPNPFNPTTKINYSLAEKAPVEIDIYNVKGQKVCSLFKGISDKGNHSITWDGKDNNKQTVGSGIYFYNMKSGKYTASGKMILMK